MAIGVAATPAHAQPAIDGALPSPLPLLPSNNWWNVDISSAPVDKNSAAFISFIDNGNGPRRLHPDWGGSAHDTSDPNGIYGIPYISVPGTQPLVPVTFVDFGDESDAGAPGRPAGYPIPDEAKAQPGWMEGGAPASQLDEGLDSNSGDRHMLIVDRDNRILYELYRAHWNASMNRWEAGSGAVFPLTSNLRRPKGWTSADAAGLAIMPGLARYDEAFGTQPIKHALRMTVRDSNSYVYPASHDAGSRAGALPMGARLRLKASVNISSYPAHVQRLFQAMKTYGLIVADNGSDMYITGSSDPRWDSQMDSLVTSFAKLNADMFDVIQLGWQPPADTDGDGLPDDWETQFGLDPNDATGVNGASGDPDHDGLTNLQEFQNHTDPTGNPALTRYFAEGSNNTFFQTTIDLANPGTQDATVNLRFLRSDGVVIPYVLTVAAQRHVAVVTTAVSGIESADFSTVIETNQLVVAERTMVWTPDERYGSHTETSVKAPSTDWFFAEGATHGIFSLFYLLANATDQDAQVQIRYLLPGGQAPIVLSYDVGPHSRLTIPVDEQPGLAATDVSAVIQSVNGVPIIAERAMYFTPAGQPSFTGGSDSAGVTAPNGHWFFAEGATGGFFNMFLLLANPSATNTANATVSYLLENGTVIPVHHTLPPNSRQTYNVADEAPALKSANMSTVVDSDVPIVAERSMYWPLDWAESSNSPGTTETGTKWAVAGGSQGGTFGDATYVLIANTSSSVGTARVTVLLDNAAPITKDFTLQPNSRTNVNLGTSDFAAANGTRFGVIVESLGTTPAQIVVERSSYSNDSHGTTWAAGGVALATKLQ